MLEHTASKPYKTGDGTIVLMLALNLIILAFFILLNALATQSEEKAKMAVMSTTQGEKVQQAGAAEGLEDTFEDTARWQSDTEEKVAGVLTNSIKLDAVGMEVSGKKLIVTLPLNMFFTDSGTQMREASLGLLQDILAVLDANAKASILVQQPTQNMALGVQQSASLLTTLSAGAEGGLRIIPGWRLGKPALVMVLTPPAGPQGGTVLEKAVAPAANFGHVEAE